MIDLKNVTVVYDNGVQALTDVTTFVDKGEFLFLVGATGHGKSSLVKLVYREHLPTQGEVWVAGRNVAHLSSRQVPYLRRRIGVVFQDFRLLPNKTVYENVCFVLQVTGCPRRERHSRTTDVLEQVGLAHKWDSFPSQLSGGEQQRVAIARAFANHPLILLADEPTGNLDPDTSWDIVQLLAQINVAGTTVLVATHDQHIVDGMKRRVITLEEGRIVSDQLEGAYRYDCS